MDWFFALGLGYLLGSVPFGLILTRMFGTADLRSIGSGNIGATNVLRTGNKGLAAATLLLDAGKGAAAVFLAARLFGMIPIFEVPLAALGALIGHCFPVWLKFKGGKGVATMLGVSLALNWWVGLIALLVWVVTAAVTRISSLSGMCAALSAPVAAIIVLEMTDGGLVWTYLMVFSTYALAIMAAIVIWQHRANIKRLLAGTEPKIGQKTQ